MAAILKAGRYDPHSDDKCRVLRSKPEVRIRSSHAEDFNDTSVANSPATILRPLQASNVSFLLNILLNDSAAPVDSRDYWNSMELKIGSCLE